MSREVRRVPRDFAWPLDTVWEGYLMPDRLQEEPCQHCHLGETWSSRWLYLLCSRINMLAEDVRAQQQSKPMHPWLAGDTYPAGDWLRDADGNAVEWVISRPSEDIIDLLAGIAGKAPNEIGHMIGSGNPEHALYKAIVKASGVPEWGSCEHCQGHGSNERYPGQRAEADAWERTPPPTGEGWQLWNTVSDGKPVSPVFGTAEELAEWLTTSAGGRAIGPGGAMTIDQALGFVDVGWAPTGIGNAGGIHDGPSFIGSEAVLADLETRLGGGDDA